MTIITNAGTKSVTLRGTGIDTGTPQMEISPTSLSFGSVNVGSTSSKTFTISNPGTAALYVTSITVGTGSGQYSLSHASINVAAGSSKTVTVTFQPTSAGSKSGTIAIEAEDIPQTKSVILSGTGVATGAPVMTLSPSSSTIAFGEVNVGSRSDKKLTVKNTGTADLVISSATLLSRTSFLIGQTAWQNRTLAPGESGEISIGFKPTKNGYTNDVLTIVSNAGNKEIMLTGTGLASGVLSVSPTSVSFGQVSVGSNSVIKITLKNTGTADLVVNDAVMESRTDFLVGAGTWRDKTLAPGESGEMNIKFQPKSTGKKTDVVTITTSVGSKTVSVNGTGI